MRHFPVTASVARGVFEMQQEMAADPAAIERAPIASVRMEAARRDSLTERTVARTHQVLAGRPGRARTALAFAAPAGLASTGSIALRHFATNLPDAAKYCSGH